MTKLETALNTFGAVKQSGANGEKLAVDVIALTANLNSIVTTFEAGSQDPVWINSFVGMAGTETLEYAQQVYIILKETQAKLDALG